MFGPRTRAVADSRSRCSSSSRRRHRHLRIVLAVVLGLALPAHGWPARVGPVILVRDRDGLSLVAVFLQRLDVDLADRRCAGQRLVHIPAFFQFFVYVITMVGETTAPFEPRRGRGRAHRRFHTEYGSIRSPCSSSRYINMSPSRRGHDDVPRRLPAPPASPPSPTACSTRLWGLPGSPSSSGCSCSSSSGCVSPCAHPVRQFSGSLEVPHPSSWRVVSLPSSGRAERMVRWRRLEFAAVASDRIAAHRRPRPSARSRWLVVTTARRREQQRPAPPEEIDPYAAVRRATLPGQACARPPASAPPPFRGDP